MFFGIGSVRVVGARARARAIFRVLNDTGEGRDTD